MGPFESCPCYAANIALRGKNLSFASKRGLPYFSQTQRKKGEARGRDGNGRDAFIYRFALKWTRSITREEHMLYIIA